VSVSGYPFRPVSSRQEELFSTGTTEAKPSIIQGGLHPDLMLTEMGEETPPLLAIRSRGVGGCVTSSPWQESKESRDPSG
jgi:hypothetical protein